MKKIGFILMGIGSILLIISLFMDTSVSSGFGRVNNIGLMQQQQNILFVAALMVIVGVLLVGFSMKNSSEIATYESLKPLTASAPVNQLQTLKKIEKISIDEAINKLIELEYEVSRRKDSMSFEVEKNKTTYFFKDDDELIVFAMSKTN
jgi:hypothetical protein